MIARIAKDLKLHLQSLAIIGSPPDVTLPEGHVLVTQGQRGAITGALNRFMGGDEHRRAAIAWLFDFQLAEISSSLLVNDQWWALWKWCDFYKSDETGAWLLPPTFPMECALVVGEAIKRIKAMPEIGQPEWINHLTFVLDGLANLGGDLIAVSEGEMAKREPGVKMPYEKEPEPEPQPEPENKPVSFRRKPVDVEL